MATEKKERNMTDIKDFSVMKKCLAVEKTLLRYSSDTQEEIRILETLLNLRVNKE